MPKGSSRRFHPWKEGSKSASAGSVKVMARSGLRLDSMQLSLEKIRGFKRDGLSHLKLFVKPRTSTGKRDDSSSTSTSTSPEEVSTENSPEEGELYPSFRKKLGDINDHEKWTLVQTRGTKPAPRYNHAAAVVGRKLLVIGGETGSATRNDVQMLHLGKLSWAKIGVGDSAPSKGLPIKTGPAQELPNCRGHSLITWGKTVILVGGQMDPPEEEVSVWSFDLEMDSWTTVITKGEIPSARRGQSVTRAGSILVMVGGEDSKGRKLNDLHILDLKSLMWLPLHPTGKGPSPRARHVAEMYDDRFLVVFGGETRTKISNDIYALDFDNMEWSKLKMRGLPLTPRAGHSGALVGTKWYIAGGESRVPGMLDTIVLDFVKMDWSVVTPAFQDSVAAFQGMSLSFVERKDKKFLVAFGGCGDQATNAVQVLHIPKEETPRMTLAGLLELPTTPDLQVAAHTTRFLRSQPGPLPSFLGATIPCACVSVAKSGSLGSFMDHHVSSQPSSRSVSDLSADLDRDSGLVPLRMRYAAMQSSQKVEPLARPARPTSHVSRDNVMARRRLSKDSNWDPITSSRRRDLALPKLKDPPSAVEIAEASVRQHQSAQRIRGEWQVTEITAPPSVESGIHCAEELQITAPSVHPGLVSSVGDAGTLLLPTASNLSSRGRSGKGGSQSSEFSGYAETSVSGNGEELNNSERSIDDSTRSLGSHVTTIPAASTGCASEASSSGAVSYYEEDEHHRSSNGTVSDYVEAERNRLSTERNLDECDDEAVAVSRCTASGEEDELDMLAELEKADCALERSMAISKLRETHERKLAAAIRTGELLAGQFAEALRNRDEAERILHTVNESRQHAEGRLSRALKQIKELQDRLSATELAREESNHLILNARVEKLKLEQDLALKNAVLGESQKELQATRGVLIAEGTRAFQLQVELFDAKHKLQNLNPCALPPHAQIQQQPILA